MDSIILSSVLLTPELSIRTDDFTFTPVELHCLNFCGKNACRNYHVNACYLDKEIECDEFKNISCLIQLSKFYKEDEFYHLFDICNDLEGFRYGKVIGVIGEVKYMERLCI